MSYTPLTEVQICELASAFSLPYSTRSFARAVEAAATAPLLERIAELYREVAETCDENTQLERENERLRAALAEASKDAERYRWLRDSKIEDDQQEWLCVGLFDMGGVSEVDGVELDAAIDAAMTPKEKTK